MPHIRTSQETEFLKYFRSINKHTIKNIWIIRLKRTLLREAHGF
jgi:hypothetical protein